MVSRYMTDSEEGFESTIQAEVSEYDLITFLAVVQKVQVVIIPITWQSAPVEIARGARSTIYEAFINWQTNFALKCVSDRQKQKLLKTNSFRTLINEVTVLSQLRGHRNIIELKGICWDVTTDDEVWPVLMFEKAPFGDLYDFLKRPVGRDLSFPERLSLCIDIGNAVIDMHSHGILIRFWSRA